MKWFWVLGRQNIVTPFAVHAFADRWDEYTESIMAYPFKPPLLARDSDAGEHNEALNVVIGHVAEWRVLTAEEADAKGLDSRGVDALYALVEPVADWVDLDSVVYVSPLVEEGARDETGAVWPCVISHVAEVSVPMQRLAQPDQRALSSLAMSRAGGGGFSMADVTQSDVDEAVDVVEETAETVAEVGEVAADFAAQLAELREQQAMILEHLASLKPAASEAEAPAGDGAQTLAMSRQISQMVAKTMSAEMEAQRRADDLLGARQWTGSREQLVALCRDQAMHAQLKRSLAPKVSPAPRTATQSAKAGLAMHSSKSLDERARDIMRAEGLRYSEALAKARAKGGA